MECPVCEKEMDSWACGCGYDGSRDYEKFPTFGQIPEGIVSVSGQRDRRNNLVRCEGCGGHTFVINKKMGSLACSGCGRALSAEELRPLADALGMQKTARKPEPKPEMKPAAPKQTAPAQSEKLVMPGDLLNVLGKIRQKQAAEPKADPRRIVAVSAGYNHTAVLYADGTAAAVGSNKYGECNLSFWNNLVAVAAGFGITTGLKKDGTVVQAGGTAGRNAVSQWRDIVAVSEGVWHTVGLKKDGTVVAAGSTTKGRCDVSGWRDIVAISAGEDFTMGLDKYGKVVMAGKGKATKLPIGGWNNRQRIAAGYEHSVSMTRDGSVNIVGSGGIESHLGKDIVQLDAGLDFTLVRKKDGTAAAAGVNYDGRCSVGDWHDLEQIAAGRRHSVGLKKDGTLVATGSNDKGQCDVHKLIRR